MQAIVCRRYGPPEVLRCEEVAMPSPAAGEVLVRVLAAALNPLDWHLMRGTPYPLRMEAGLRAPKDPRMGHDLAGVVEAAGPGATRLRPGDAVFGAGRGAFAQYVGVKEDSLAPTPAGLSFEQAAALPVAAFTALQGLRDSGRLQPGQSALINGAAGGVGTLAVQVAKALGAEVTGVCSTRNLDLVRSLGAAHAVDYTQEDFTQGSRRYDLIFDCMGNRPLRAVRRVLRPQGHYVLIGGPDGRWLGPLRPLIKARLLSPFVSQTMTSMLSQAKHEDLLAVKELIEAGQVMPVVDRTYPLPEAAAAMAYLEEGHARGKVVLTMDGM